MIRHNDTAQGMLPKAAISLEMIKEWGNCGAAHTVFVTKNPNLLWLSCAMKEQSYIEMIDSQDILIIKFVCFFLPQHSVLNFFHVCLKEPQEHIHSNNYILSV